MPFRVVELPPPRPMTAADRERDTRRFKALGLKPKFRRGRVSAAVTPPDLIRWTRLGVFVGGRTVKLRPSVPPTAEGDLRYRPSDLLSFYRDCGFGGDIELAEVAGVPDGVSFMELTPPVPRRERN
jgi:hypothetical protein